MTFIGLCLALRRALAVAKIGRAAITDMLPREVNNGCIRKLLYQEMPALVHARNVTAPPTWSRVQGSKHYDLRLN